MKKRVLALFLSICLLLGLLPVTAMAAGTDLGGGLTIDGGAVSGTDYDYVDGVLTIKTDKAMTLSGTSTTERIVIAGGMTANLTFSGLDLTLKELTPVTLGAGSTLNLTLTGTNKLVTTMGNPTSVGSNGLYNPAIRVPADATLAVSGSGDLSAVSDRKSGNVGTLNGTSFCAAIGAETTELVSEDSGKAGVAEGRKAGTITFDGTGTVYAYGGAGIGGDGAKITVRSGTVQAFAHTHGEALGGAGSAVELKGGTVKAAVYNYSAIGGEASTVTVENTNVLAHNDGGVGATVGAGIGGDRAKVTIKSGTVKASGDVGIGGSGSVVKIQGGTVEALGRTNGAGIGSCGEAYDIHISGGEVTAEGGWSFINLGTGDFTKAESYHDKWSGGGGWGIGNTVNQVTVPTRRTITIDEGADVKAKGGTGGIGGDSDNASTEVGEPLTITIGGNAKVTAIARDGSGNIPFTSYGIGGTVSAAQKRTITIDGNAEVRTSLEGAGNLQSNGIGGGDNSGSTITIKGSARLFDPAYIGSTGSNYDSPSVGFAGGTIEILENASIYKNLSGDYPRDGAGHIGGADVSNGTGGAGGNITIHTTGKVAAVSIGGGKGDQGGNGGTIAIKSGTLMVEHIGGGNGDGYTSSGDAKTATGMGGSGGNITISGGKIGESGYVHPSGGHGLYAGNQRDKMYYAHAGIGGGGGTLKGGDGGNITISGGDVFAAASLTVYDANGDSYGITTGEGVGGAAIGGGNGAGGGNITISGGRIRTDASLHSSDITAATKMAAMIGGGSGGAAGNITLSGGFTNTQTSGSGNEKPYGADVSNLGAGKGATEAGGFVKIIGGSLIATNKNTDSRPGTWPTGSDGSAPLYPVTLYFNSAANLPSEYEGNYFFDGVTLQSLTVKGTDGSVYNYSTDDMKLSNSAFSIWLPVPGGHGGLSSAETKAYDLAITVRKENTSFQFSGVVNFSKLANPAAASNYYHDGVRDYTPLTYGGKATETLILTSDWTSGAHTYDGTVQTPAFTVKNSRGDTLALGTDYTLLIERNTSASNWVTVNDIRDAGSYRVKATGVNGTAYAGMTATLGHTDATLHINPKTVQATLTTAQEFTKPYDGQTVVRGADGKEITALALSVTGVVSGDSLTNVKMENPHYAQASIGTGIGIGGSITCTGNEKGNYNIVAANVSTTPATPTITGAITVKVLGPTSLDASGVTVSKTYDGTAAKGNITGHIALKDLVGSELATVSITGVSDYADANVGSDKVVTLSIGSLSGANSGNYQLAGGLTSVQIANAKILPADYTYTLTAAEQAQEFTQGGSLSQITVPQTASGVRGETVTGTATLHTDAACTVAATDAVVSAWGKGTHNLYVKFVPDSAQTNYTSKVTTGRVIVLTVVEGAPQELTWSDGVGGKLVAYGDGTVAGKTAANASVGGGAITYSSSNTAAVEVNATTGALTIKAASPTAVTITAKAAAVEGQYRETVLTYPLTVSKKAVTVVAADKNRLFGQDNPVLTLEDPSAVLVGNDTEADLGVTLRTTASKTSYVGTYPITGVGSSDNYDVTVTAGSLIVGKAPALTTIPDSSRQLAYGLVHDTEVYQFAGMFPNDRGTTTYNVAVESDADSILNGAPTVSADGVLTFSTNAMSAPGGVATIAVTATMQNYEESTAKFVVKLVDKTAVTITGVTATGKTYDGAALAYTGSPANDQGYDGTYLYIWSTPDGAAPKHAGTYTLRVQIPESDPDFMGELALTNLVIAPKALTAKPQNVAIYTGDALPTAFILEYVGLVAGDAIAVTGTPVYQLQQQDGSALADSNTAGTYVIAWTNAGDITLTGSDYAISKADGVLTISTRSSGGGGAVTPPSGKDPEISTGGGSSTATVKPESTTSGGKTTAVVGSDLVKDAIAAAEKAAAANNTKPALEILVETPAGATSLEVSLPKTALDAVANSKAESLTISSGIGDITMSRETAASIAKQAGGADVKVSVGMVDTAKSLNEKQRAAVGNAPVYDISVQSGGKQITTFDGGLMTVALPYTLKPGEDPSGVVVWYVDQQGNVQKVTTMYDVKTKTVIFTTNHLSLYAIGYDPTAAWENPFTDIAQGSYYYDAVLWAYHNQVTSGTTATTFSPLQNCTRAQVVTLLWNAMGRPAPTTTANPFADVTAGSYYYDAVLWAAEQGITNGTTATTFSPNATVTRGQFVTFLWKAAGKPAAASGNPFTDVTDANAYYHDAVLWAYGEKVTNGTSATTFSPNASCVRAQVVTILYNHFGK